MVAFMKMIARLATVAQVATLSLIAALAMAGTAQAQSGATGSDIPILVLQDDSNELSLRSSTSVAQYIETKVKEQFSRYQYYVVDRNALIAQLGFDLDGRMDSATAMRIASAAKESRQAQFDIRGLVIVKVYPQIRDEGFRKKLVVEIAGEVHDMDANRYIGDFGPLSKTFGAPADCKDQACISAVLRENAIDVAAIVADEGRKKLALLTKTGGVAGVGGSATSGRNDLVTTFTFRFENFTMDQVLMLKGVMDGEFPDFVRAGRISGSDPIIEYGYTTKAPQHKIFEWLNIAVNDMGITDAKILADGSKFTIKRLASDLPPQQQDRTSPRFR